MIRRTRRNNRIGVVRRKIYVHGRASNRRAGRPPPRTLRGATRRSRFESAVGLQGGPHGPCSLRARTYYDARDSMRLVSWRSGFRGRAGGQRGPNASEHTLRGEALTGRIRAQAMTHRPTHTVREMRVDVGIGVIVADLHTLAPANDGPLAVFIPGGGLDPDRTRPTTALWERAQLAALATAGVEGLTFNFPGIGRSLGRIADNTLNRRGEWVNTLVTATRTIIGERPLILVGCSMGGHVAATIAPGLVAARCVLVAPAAYGAHAVDEPFGPRFSAALRRPSAWADSPAFAAAAAWREKSSLIIPDRDETIPLPVTQAYERSIRDGGTTLVLRGASHGFLRGDTPEDEIARGKLRSHLACVSQAIGS